MRNSVALLRAIVVITAISGCTSGDRVDLIRQAGGSAALFSQFQAYDERTATPLSFQDIIARTDRVDVVLFGEEHSDVVCNAFEAQLLARLSKKSRPMTLAMEFFETDTQAALDAYLCGRMAESEFRTQARQKNAYLLSHRPLIEYCRAACIPVIAANAPRRLMRAWRESGLPYEEFRAGLNPSERALLPPTCELLAGPYYDRFVEAMSGHEMPTTAPATQPTTGAPASQPTSQPDREAQLLRAYQAQSLWDDTMAESVAEHRRQCPERRVLLIVGAFHIARDGGTSIKLQCRRRDDSFLTIVYQGTSDARLAFDEADRGAGDIVIYGLKPPDPEQPPTTSAPTTGPAVTLAPQIPPEIDPGLR
jgi:uncharacterized iron-regulated protein